MVPRKITTGQNATEKKKWERNKAKGLEPNFRDQGEEETNRITGRLMIINDGHNNTINTTFLHQQVFFPAQAHFIIMIALNLSSTLHKSMPKSIVCQILKLYFCNISFFLTNVVYNKMNSYSLISDMII